MRWLALGILMGWIVLSLPLAVIVGSCIGYQWDEIPR